MATAISQANFATAVGECYDAIVAENWSSAKKWLALAEAQNAGLKASAEIDAVRIQRRDSLKALRDAIKEAQDGVTGPWEITSRLVP